MLVSNIMDPLTLFGLFAVTAMVVFYALERRSPWFILAFVGACALASVYGFLQGAWPFGVVEIVWSGVAVWRWRSLRGATVKGEALDTGTEKTAQEIILEIIQARGEVKRKDLLRVTGMTKSNLGRLLDAMEAKGLIAQQGKRKAAFYTKGKNL